jgi:hypothetical protein
MRFPENVVALDDTRSGGGGAGRPDKCFYCSGKIGREHDADCVTLDKPVKVRLTLDLVLTTVRGWTKEQSERRWNEGSWCADNIISDIERHCADGHCLCNRAHIDILGDATMEEAKEAGLVPRNPDDDPGTANAKPPSPKRRAGGKA